MYKDEIIDEVRKNREAFAAKFNFDPDKIFKEGLRLQKRRKNLVRTGIRNGISSSSVKTSR